jgi:protein gp37
LSAKTLISWCDSTWNWARGCEKVSPGCKNCYITTTAPFRVAGMKHGDPRVRAGESTFNAPLAWNKKPWVCDECGKAYSHPQQHECPTISKVLAFPDETNWHRRRVFSLSLGDWLDDKIPKQWLADALQIMFECQELDFILLSKRLEKWFPLMDLVWCGAISYGMTREARQWLKDWINGNPPVNLWILGSAENQAMLEKRSRELSRIPAVVRGLSCEPMLEHLDFNGCHILPDWVIFGGESGKDARVCNINWILDGLDQLNPLATKRFVKQLGAKPQEMFMMRRLKLERRPVELKHKAGADPAEWPEDLRVQEWPKSASRYAPR